LIADKNYSFTLRDYNNPLSVQDSANTDSSNALLVKPIFPETIMP